MSKEAGVILLGIFTLVVPFLGFPSSWRTAMLVLAGGGLIVIGFLLRAEALSRIGRSGSGTAGPRHSFVENGAASSEASTTTHEREEVGKEIH